MWRLSFISVDGAEGTSYEEVKKARGGESPPEADEENVDGGGDAEEQKQSDDETDENETGSPLRCIRLGTILRQGKGT